MTRDEILRVVLDAKVEDAGVRVYVRGVFDSGDPLPGLLPDATRNVVEVFAGRGMDVRALFIPTRDDRG